jgi:hypothetical protein
MKTPVPRTAGTTTGMAFALVRWLPIAWKALGAGGSGAKRSYRGQSQPKTPAVNSA